MSQKPKVYFTSKVFTPQIIGSNEKINSSIRKEISDLWKKLQEIAEVKIFEGRFPSLEEIKRDISSFNPQFLGCHLSHSITKEMLIDSEIVAISTSTAGYNHIERTEDDDIIITHTPGVLHETVADYTIALIMANLRNIVDLHNYVWNGKWTKDDKWDLDQQLSSVISHKTIGIVGMGEIGSEVLKKLYPWGLKIIYYDIRKREDLEQKFPGIEFKTSLNDIFKEADIISLHIPLNKHTQNLINKNLLKLMKNNSLLINTARGGVLNLDDMLNLLENREIQINFALDVFPEEPIDKETLERFKKIKAELPHIRMILMPHNASADADTRGRMVIIFLKDIINLIESKKIEDLEKVHVIPEHRRILNEKRWRIQEYWKKRD
ncbi:MAG: NAD(P)-dependent oxidoreductase [Promethearchaeota archaeon]